MTRRGEYIELIENFLKGSIAVEDFEKEFLSKFKDEPLGMNESEFLILDSLFSAVDSFDPTCQPGEESAFRISISFLRKAGVEARDALLAVAT